jgi:branched-chain amino acid transport system ATP-binding protein
MTEPLALEVEDLRVRYGKASAVRGVSIRLEPGSFTAIVGPNGAGKSSLLQGILGLVTAEQTSLVLDGRSLQKASPTERARAGLVLVPQGRRIFPTLTVLDNLRVVADGLGAEGGCVDEALDRFPILRRRASSMAGVLSGGEQQMLALSRALMLKPKVLLLDEPTEGLAPTIVSVVVDALGDIQAAGATIVVVEPTTRILPDQIDCGYVMMRGRFAARAGNRDELKSAFQDEFEQSGSTASARGGW